MENPSTPPSLPLFLFPRALAPSSTMIRLNSTSNAINRRISSIQSRQSIEQLAMEEVNNEEPQRNPPTDNSTVAQANKIMLELLGENVSALGSHNNMYTDSGDHRKRQEDGEDDGESSTMSSIFSGLMAKYQQTSKTTATTDGRELPSQPNLHEARKHYLQSSIEEESRLFRQEQPQVESLRNKQLPDDGENASHGEEDTYMTKPREITFDSLSDDVSGLFGGGGVSTVNNIGIESYMGTYASHRKNRKNQDVAVSGRHSLTKKTFRQEPGKQREGPRIGGSPSIQSFGVTSILNDIGVRSVKSKLSVLSEGSNDSGDEKGNKGYYSRYYSSSSRRRIKDSFVTDAECHPRTLWKRVLKMNNTTFGLIVIVVYVMLQVPTVQKRDKMAMKTLKQGFIQRYENEANYDLGDGGPRVLRRRERTDREGFQEENRQAIHPEKESFEREWEEERMLDDGMDHFRQKDLRSTSETHGIRDALQDNKQSNTWNAVQEATKRGYAEDVTTNLRVDNAQYHFKHINQMDNILPSNDDHARPLFQPDPDRSNAIVADKLSDIDPIEPDPDDSIPSKYRVFADLTSPYLPGRDTPFFWHIPRSGGVVMKTLMSHCLHMTLATEVGELEGHNHDEELKVVKLFDHNYTNVNLATEDGIARAQSLGLIPSHLADTIASAQVDKIPLLFTSNERARSFVLFRNPVDRAVSMFYFLKSMGNERLKNMTLDDYAKSDMIENNWIVRMLSESMTGPINSVNLEIAQEVLRRKFIVGIIENKRGSFARFDHYFKWKDNPNYDKEFGCIKQVMDEKHVPKHPLRKGEESWNLIFEQNRYDMLLYEYAKELFKKQSMYIFGLE